MLRLRLKADGRIVELLADGSERAMPPAGGLPVNGAPGGSPRNGAVTLPVRNGAPCETPAAYARRVRGATRLTQNAFAARIGVPVETVRNWEQGKRAPRGPARALLKIIDRAPDTAFAMLAAKSGAQ
jgi:putative transcriptional regulator